LFKKGKKKKRKKKYMNYLKSNYRYTLNNIIKKNQPLLSYSNCICN